MNARITSILLGALLLAATSFVSATPIQRNTEKKDREVPIGSAREKLLLDFGWKFHLGDASSPGGDFNFGLGTPFAKAGEAVGAVHPNFNDSTWRTLDLPHDWAVEQEFVNVRDDDVKSHGYKPIGRQFPKTTVGWYRRAFFIPKSDEGRRLEVKFDGIFRDCIVWLNGHYLGNNLSGYREFGYDITDYAKYGQKNVLVVRVDASQYEGWFYEGAGIYRHTWLLKHGHVHIPEYGIFVHTEVGKNSARVKAETEVVNDGDDRVTCEVLSSVVDERGRSVASALAPGVTLRGSERKTVRLNIAVSKPLLWSLEDPHLYTLISLVKSRGKIIDSVTTVFGIRTVRFDKDKGFFLNGRRVEIKGVCCHQDHAGVGSALPDRLQYYRIERLKEMGCNAYRTSHNPPTNELLEACDRLGMLVMDENRLMGSSPELMGQFEQLILRDRNHPSVVIWSLGNEEWLIQNSDVGKRLAQSLIRKLKELDPTRIYSYAANNGNQYEGINSVLPVRGFNYMTISDIDKYRNDHPDQILFGSEEASTLCTRGIYANDTLRGYLCDYDVNAPGWGATAEKWWRFYAARPWLAGAFVWTGFDYRGEPTPYSWPCINSHFGIMDMCGFPKNNFFYYQAWWSNKDVLHIAPHWNWRGKEGQIIDVWCQSNCESVELLLKGKSLGKKTMEPNSHLEWKVAYEPGVLEARGWKQGRMVTTKVETTGEPVSIRLTADRSAISADGGDVSVVNVTTLDDRGREVPNADNLVRFEVVGNGKIIGVGNGDPSSHEPDKYLSDNYQRRLFNGKCQVIVQSTKEAGAVKLRASSEGLKTEVITIRTEPCEPRPSVSVYTPMILKHKAVGKKVEYKNTFHPRYSAGGPSALVNGMMGSTEFGDGLWQGFEHDDLEAEIDLGEITAVKKISSNYLQDFPSWIFLPTSVEYSVSENGENFKVIATVQNDVPIDKEGSFLKAFSGQFLPTQARYIKVHAKNIGVLPPRHRSAGGKAWLFVDEVIVE
jgi:beta-galactosidase